MKCDNCKNKDICRYIDYMSGFEEKLKSIDLGNSMSDFPIRAEIECSYYTSKKDCEKGTTVKFFPLGNFHENIKDKQPYDYPKIWW